MKNIPNLNASLAEILSKENAHIDIESALEGLTVEEAGTTYRALPYTIWQLLEHIRISLWDIIYFSESPDYMSPKWPDEYWPTEKAPGDREELNKSLTRILEGNKKMIELVGNAQNDLLQPFAHGNGQNLLREALLVIDHTAYHLGQIVVLRRLLGNFN